MGRMSRGLTGVNNGQNRRPPSPEFSISDRPIRLLGTHPLRRLWLFTGCELRCRRRRAETFSFEGLLSSDTPMDGVRTAAGG